MTKIFKRVIVFVLRIKLSYLDSCFCTKSTKLGSFDWLAVEFFFLILMCFFGLNPFEFAPSKIMCFSVFFKFFGRLPSCSEENKMNSMV